MGENKGTAMPWFDPRPVPVRFEVGNLALEQVFLSVVFGFPCQHHSTSAPYAPYYS